MQQFDAPEESKIEIDFDRPGIPYTASLLQPVLFKNGNKYCCIWGPDLEKAIVGFGESPEKAIQDWDHVLAKRVDMLKADDMVGMEAKDLLLKHVIGSQPKHSKTSQVKEDTPHSITTDKLHGTTAKKSAQDLPSQKNTTNQSNNDGSE